VDLLRRRAAAGKGGRRYADAVYALPDGPIELSSASVAASGRIPAVVVDGVGKTFALPRERVHTLKERVLHPLRRTGINRLEALRDVSFAVEPGEFFGIVGRNGSGKSTLLKCLAGIYRIDVGQIHVDGRMSTFIELGVGFNPDLAALDNVVMNAVMLGVPPRKARERFDDVITFAELEEFVDLKLKNYSSGMLVRLAFSTAIQADADILLIDEVLAVGDAAFQQKCFDVFHRLRKEGKTILFVTHDMGSVVRFCDRALLLERGEVVTIARPDVAAQRYLELNFGRRHAEGEPNVRDSDGSTRILEAWTEDEGGGRRTTFMSTERIVLKARIRFQREMVDPNFNVVWVNEQDQNVFAVSTAADADPTGRFAAGDVVVLRTAFVASFAPGRYEPTMVISRAGTGHHVVERWARMFSVVVASPNAAGGIVDLPHDLSIERERVLI
jgi:ABC-type polysaccharide/polyol phosphate transport system ATPase subunit